MRHIHVELAHKKAPLELPAHEGDLPPPTAPTQVLEPGVRPGMPGHCGPEDVRLQKVYQLSIFSQLGGFTASSEAHVEAQPRPIRAGVKRGLEEAHLQAHKRPLLGDAGDCSEGGSPVMEPRDCGGGLSPKSPPLSPNHAPSRRPHAHERPLPDAFAPLSPKSPPMCDPHHCEHAQNNRTSYSLGGPGPEPCGTQPAPHSHEMSTYESPNPASPTSPPGPFSPPHHSELQEPGEATEWGVGLESSPPERSATQACSPRPASWDKTPSSAPRASLGTLWAVKKRLLSPSETAESCSEDEGPSTSKRSRVSARDPGLGLASCRSTDSKAAPYWNHLLWDRPKTATDCLRSGKRLKNVIRLKSRRLRSGRCSHVRSPASDLPSSSISRALLGNFEESILKGRFTPSGWIEGFTAELGASGSYCPEHVTLPVQVTYYDISEHSAPTPFLGVVSLEPLGKKGYSVPKAGTIQVTLFNPNKTVVKMFLVTYNFSDMPVNHMTFLRHRIFLLPVEEAREEATEEAREEATESNGVSSSKVSDRKKILCYLMHLRFQSSKSGKLYLHNDIRLLFSRKSIEVDSGIPYELKSFTEVPRNPTYSSRL